MRARPDTNRTNIKKGLTMKHGPILTMTEADAVAKDDPRCVCGYRKSTHVDGPCNNNGADRDMKTGFKLSLGFANLYRHVQ